MDTLSLLLSRFAVSAGVFYTGRICGVHGFPEDTARAHLHLIERGPVALVDAHGRSRQIVQPTILFLPRPERHRLIADDLDGAQVLCATVQFGGGSNANPVSDSLPDTLSVELGKVDGGPSLLDLITQEAFGAQPGAQTAVDRLCELLIIRLLRYCLKEGLTTGGTLAGLADARLAKALAAMHREPTRGWELEDMAAEAGMSRARFAARFREVTGQTPVHYLAAWRIALAQNLLKRGHPMKQVCEEAGYSSASSFTRAFVRQVGTAPSQWLKDIEAQARARPVTTEPAASASIEEPRQTTAPAI